jgi:hypothetical protein
VVLRGFPQPGVVETEILELVFEYRSSHGFLLGSHEQTIPSVPADDVLVNFP